MVISINQLTRLGVRPRTTAPLSTVGLPPPAPAPAPVVPVGSNIISPSTNPPTAPLTFNPPLPPPPPPPPIVPSPVAPPVPAPPPQSIVDQLIGDQPSVDPNPAARRLFGEGFAGSPLITPGGFEQLRQGLLPLFNQITPGFLLYGSPIMRETLAGLFESSSIRPQDLLFEISKNRPPGFTGEGVGLNRFGGFSLL